MDQDERERKKFLEEQVEWCKEQKRILDEIDKLLYEMKAIAEYVLQNESTPNEIKELNQQLDELKREIHFLEQKLYVEVLH